MGIGTTSPGAKLEVNAGTGSGTISSPAVRVNTPVLDATNQDAVYLFENGGQASGKQSISWYNGNQNYYKARLWTEVGGNYLATTFGIDVADNARNVATRLAIRNGNVGIGTMAPISTLDVRSSSIWRSLTVGGNGGTDIVVIGNSQNTATIGAHNSAADTWANLAINPGAGNVGIGTTSPGATLHVKCSTDPAIILQSNGTAEKSLIYGQDSTGANKFALNINVSGGAGWSLFDYNSAWYRGITQLSGNVGIGTTAPGYTLDVNGTIRATGTITGSVTKLVTSDTRSTDPAPQTYSQGIVSDFKYNTADGLSDGGTYHGVLTFRQWSSGSDWSGGGVRQLGFTDNHNLWIRGANADNTWSAWNVFSKTASSRKWKENISEIGSDEALVKIMLLKPVHFKWKKDFGDKNDTGFIAEDVSEVIPEAAVWNGENIAGVSTEQIIAYLTKVVQAQQRRIENLEVKRNLGQ